MLKLFSWLLGLKNLLSFIQNLSAVIQRKGVKQGENEAEHHCKKEVDCHSFSTSVIKKWSVCHVKMWEDKYKFILVMERM